MLDIYLDLKLCHVRCHNSHAKAPLSSFFFRNCGGLLVERLGVVHRWIGYATLVFRNLQPTIDCKMLRGKQTPGVMSKKNRDSDNGISWPLHLSLLTFWRAASITEREKFHVLPTPCTLFKWAMLASSLDWSLCFRSLDVPYCTKLRPVLS